MLGPTDAIDSPGVLTPASIEFFSIQLSSSADGRFYVGIEATVCDGEADLTHMDLGHHGAPSIDAALDVIRSVVTAH